MLYMMDTKNPKYAKGKSKDSQTSSRSTTPPNTGGANHQTPDIQERMAAYTSLSLDLLTPSSSFGPSGPLSNVVEAPTVPEARRLKDIQSELKQLAEGVTQRSEVYNRGIRSLATQMKELESGLASGVRERQSHTRRSRVKDSGPELVERKGRSNGSRTDSPKSRRDSETSTYDRHHLSNPRPPTHGERRMPADDESMKMPQPSLHALGIAEPADPPPDIAVGRSHEGVDAAAGAPMGDGSATRQSRQDSAHSGSGVMGERQPTPIPAVLWTESTGSEESSDDEMLYNIEQVNEGFSEADIKSAYQVTEYPHDDLQHLLPGPPPDANFVNAKPPSQVTINTWLTFFDLYFKAFADDDLAFLRDRGDRVSPFLIPLRGQLPYQDLWADEDGLPHPSVSALANRGQPRYQPRGTVDELSDFAAENERLSSGPLLARLLTCLRPELDIKPDAQESVQDQFSLSGIEPQNDGSISLFGPDLMDIDVSTPVARTPSTYFAETLNARVLNPPKLDYSQVEERLKQELRYIGVIPEDGEPEYSTYNDDEISGRLRCLQKMLRQQSIVNGARKSRLIDFVRDRMAAQEYQTIQEDLDTQVNAVFQKRTRALKSRGKVKRPAGLTQGNALLSGIGTTRSAIGDLAKTLMERRRKWQDCIGPVFDEGMNECPQETIFSPEVMVAFMAQERELWDEADDA